MARKLVQFTGSDGRHRRFYASKGSRSKSRSTCRSGGCETLLQFRRGKALRYEDYNLGRSPAPGDVFRIGSKGLYVLGKDGWLRAVREVHCA